jgi:hypothetical protein
MQFYRFVSYLFHPVVYPVFIVWVYLKTAPYYISTKIQHYVLYITLVGAVLLPVLILWFLKKSGIITSFKLPGREERKHPFLLFIMIAFLLGRLFMKVTGLEVIALYYYAGAAGMSMLYACLFIRLKASMHTLAIGVSTGYLLYLSVLHRINMLWMIVLFFLLFALVGYARYKLRAHSLQEIFLGYICGLVAPLLIGILW